MPGRRYFFKIIFPAVLYQVKSGSFDKSLSRFLSGGRLLRLRGVTVTGVVAIIFLTARMAFAVEFPFFLKVAVFALEVGLFSILTVAVKFPDGTVLYKTVGSALRFAFQTGECHYKTVISENHYQCGQKSDDKGSGITAALIFFVFASGGISGFSYGSGFNGFFCLG